MNYTRNLTLVQAVPLDKSDQEATPYQMCELTVRGKAFLWHQIRCIVSVLFRIGAGKESPEVIKDLLDVEANPRRPQYNMASEIPLNLFHVDFDQNVEWVYDQEALANSIRQYQVGGKF